MDTKDNSLGRTISPEATSASSKNIHTFSHEAMATTYQIFIADQDKQYAAQAALEAFNLLDQLDNDLSRYMDSSDVSRINLSPADTPVKVGEDAFNCLLGCLSLYDETTGAFDITVGALMDLWLNPDKSLRHPSQADIDKAFSITGMNLLELDDDDYTVTKTKADLSIDLGGYGKGYAVEEMAALLEEWDIQDVLIHGGFSSVIARGRMPGHSGWVVSVTDPFVNKVIEKIELEDYAISSSGLMKGSHIIDPRTGKPLQRKRATWTISPEAAICDGLSTAFMVMEFDEIEAFVDAHPELSALIITQENNKNQVLRIGRWWD